MRKRLLTALLLPTTAILLSTGALAQEEGPAGPPAELPPAEYDGRQYVDSRGCAYVRAEVDGTVTWVPRLSRTREALCGFEPRAGREAAVGAAAPSDAVPGTPGVPPEPPVPAQIVVGGPVASPPVAAPPGPAPRPEPVRAEPSAAQVSPAAAVPARVQAARPVRQPRLPPCAAVAAASAALVDGSRTTCHPLAVRPPGNFDVVRQIIGPNGEITVEGGPAPVAPPGYRAAWTDDRLNPDRGKQSLNGALQTALVWTQDVPRRLVDRSSGRDMTERLHYLVYPYTDYDTQLRDLKAGTHVMVRNGQGARYIVPRSAIRMTPGRPAAARPQAPVSSQATAAATASGGGRYVQVATFGNVASATAVQAQLRARGLPVRQAKRAKGNPAHRLLLVGPFTSEDAINRALTEVRAAGFANARIR